MTQGCCKAQTHALLSVDRSSKSTAQKQMVSTEVAKRGSKEREGIDSLAAIHSQTCDSLKGSEFTYMTKDFCYSKLLRQEAIYLDYKLTVWEGKKKKNTITSSSETGERETKKIYTVQNCINIKYQIKD